MQRRTRRIAIFAGSALVGAVAFGVVAQIARRAPSVVDVLPTNTGVVVEIDLDSLRQSGRGREAIDAFDRRAAKDAPCASAILASIERVGLAIPVGAAYESDFAIVGVGKKLRAKDVVDCAQTVLRARHAEPRVQTMGSFTTVQESEGDHGVLAVRDGGPIVVGSGVWLGAIVDVADGVAPSLRDDAIHDVARRAQKGAVATLTYALPPDVRDAFAEKLPNDAKPLARVPSIVAAIRLDEAAGALVVDADAACDAPTCASLKPLADNAKDVLARATNTTLLGLREVVEAATIAIDTGKLHVSLRVQLAKLEAIAEQITSSSPPLPPLPSGHPNAEASGPMASPSPSASP